MNNAIGSTLFFPVLKQYDGFDRMCVIGMPWVSAERLSKNQARGMLVKHLTP